MKTIFAILQPDDIGHHGGDPICHFFDNSAARKNFTRELIGVEDDQEWESYLATLEEDGVLYFEGDPPLKWRNLVMGDKVKFGSTYYEIAGMEEFPHGMMMMIYDEPPSKHIDHLNLGSLTIPWEE